MRAVVTGANGFVGAYLSSELIEAGYEVIAVDRVERNGESAPPVPEGIESVLCDILDVDAVREVFSRFEPDAVFHLAAQSSASRSFGDPRGTFEANLMGALNILEADRASEMQSRMLFIGSAEEYGRREPDEMPLGEDSPIEPLNPYAASKAAQNLLAMQYFRAFGSAVLATRSFNHTGPGQRTDFALPSFARQCALIRAGKAEPVIRTGNLEVVRDFLDVRDVVRAYRLIMEKGDPGVTYNVCSGSGLKLSDSLKEMTQEAGAEVRIETDPKLLRPADIPVLVGDSSKLKKDTGWVRKIPAARMIRDLVAWWDERVR